MALPYDAIAPAASPQPRGMMRMRAVALAFGIAMVACVGLLAVGEPLSPSSERCSDASLTFVGMQVAGAARSSSSTEMLPDMSVS